MNKIRIRFSRGEAVKFIGHLDIMKVFERAIRRSSLPIAYSKGFNPHPQMVFGLPLAVGVTSDAEYADFDLTREVDTADFMEKLNESLPVGIRITAASYKNTKANIMASIAAADYEIDIFLRETVSTASVEEKINKLMEQESIMALKESKGGVKEINIRPLILNVSVGEIEEKPPGYEAFKTVLKITAGFKAGNVANLKPDLFLKALAEHTDILVETRRVHRRALYVGKGSKLFDPLDESVLNDSVKL